MLNPIVGCASGEKTQQRNIHTQISPGNHGARQDADWDQGGSPRNGGWPEDGSSNIGPQFQKILNDSRNKNDDKSSSTNDHNYNSSLYRSP